MSRFIQLHVLTAYPPSNLNRDDTGRPKTALVGDALRLRVSSQSLKRAWRTSDLFRDQIGNVAIQDEPVVEWDVGVHSYLGTRTKEAGKRVFEALTLRGVPDKAARAWATEIAAQFGEMDKASDKGPLNDLKLKQLVHFSPEERQAVDDLVKQLVAKRAAPDEASLKLLRHKSAAVDIAMFGRMLAGTPEFNTEAAVQVAHAITVHKAAVEDDFFSAVDDLNKGLEDKGAGHIDERGYGAGLFYLYICINRELLLQNLGGDETLTAQALEALLHAVTQVSPTGMQNSFASRAHASYLLAEKGKQQPRSLVQAFLKPVKPYGDRDMLALAVAALTQRCDNFDKVYGACADSRCHFDVEAAQGSLAEVVAFVKG